jgi:L-threonylcarbamoyladenylate synthase
MERFDLGKDDRDEIVKSCIEALKQPGCVLLLPTETVYGLVCRWDDEKAVERIYELKGREKAKPLALFADSTNTLRKFDIELNDKAEKVASRLCPGALTVVVPAASGQTVGFRIPDHPFVLELLGELGYPLASTSANRSGEPNALDAKSAVKMLDGEVDVVIDGGDIPANRQASTVVIISREGYKILRHGPVSESQLKEAMN